MPQRNDPFALTDADKLRICQNSMERLCNNAHRIAVAFINNKRSEALLEDAYILDDDLDELRELMAKLWNRERDTIFREQLAKRKD